MEEAQNLLYCINFNMWSCQWSGHKLKPHLSHVRWQLYHSSVCKEDKCKTILYHFVIIRYQSIKTEGNPNRNGWECLFFDHVKNVKSLTFMIIIIIIGLIWPFVNVILYASIWHYHDQIEVKMDLGLIHDDVCHLRRYWHVWCFWYACKKKFICCKHVPILLVWVVQYILQTLGCEYHLLNY